MRCDYSEKIKIHIILFLAIQQRRIWTLSRPFVRYSRYSVREIMNANISKATVHNHLIRMGYVNRCKVWITQLMTETGLMNCVSTCDLFLQWYERDFFLKKLVTWILYQNMHWKRIWFKDNRSSIVMKLGFHPKKILLSI